MWNETIPLLAASANLLVGFFVIVNGPDRPIHRTFATLMGLSFLWNFGTFLFATTGDPFWHRFLTLGSALLPVAVMRFTFLYLGVDPRARVAWTRLLLLLSSVLFVLALTPLFDTLGFRMGFTLYVVAILCGIAILVYRHYARARVPLEHHRLGYLLAALVITAGAACLDAGRDLGLPMVRLANLASLFTSVILMLAILRHRLLDIQVVLRGSLIFAVLVVMAVPLHSLLYATQHAVSLGTVATEVFLLLIATTVIFPWTTRWAQTRLTRAVLGPRSGRRALLRRMRSRTSEGDARTEDLRDPLARAMEGLTASWILLAREGSDGSPQAVIAHGQGCPGDALLASVYLVAEGIDQPIYRSEVAIHEAQSGPADKACAQAMEPAAAELLAPLRLGGELRAILLVGPPRDGTAYDALDLAFFEELTHEVRAVLVSEDARRRLEARSRLAAIGEMSAGVAHEIRNPLASMKGAVELLRARRGDVDSTEGKLLSLIEGEVERLERVVSDFLEYARPTDPKLAPERLEEIVRRTLDLLRADPSLEGITLDAVNGDTLPSVIVDAEQVRQVILNLIRNAAQAMGGQGRVMVETAPGEGEAILRVRDTGPGFAAEALRRAFDPFFTTRSRGSGLGLAIARRIVENHAGRIQIRNRAEGGAEVTITLPLANERTP
jgi:two-component system sensor histidine kinase HydH